VYLNLLQSALDSKAREKRARAREREIDPALFAPSSANERKRGEISAKQQKKNHGRGGEAPVKKEARESETSGGEEEELGAGEIIIDSHHR